MFSVLQTRCRSVDSILTDNDSGLDSLHKPLPHKPLPSKPLPEPTSERQRHDQGSPNPRATSGNKTASTWQSSSVQLSNETGNRWRSSLRQKSSSHQHISGHSFGLFGRGAATPVQPRMGVSGSLYKRNKTPSRSPGMDTVTFVKSPFTNLEYPEESPYGDHLLQTNKQKELKQSPISESRDNNQPETLILNTSTLIVDKLAENESSKVFSKSKNTLINNCPYEQECLHNSSNTTIDLTDDSAKVFNENQCPKTVRNKLRNVHLQRNSSFTENRKSKKETQKSEQLDSTNTASNLQQKRYASQNQINSEPQKCVYNNQSSRSQCLNQNNFKQPPKRNIPISSSSGFVNKIISKNEHEKMASQNITGSGNLSIPGFSGLPQSADSRVITHHTQPSEKTSSTAKHQAQKEQKRTESNEPKEPKQQNSQSATRNPKVKDAPKKSAQGTYKLSQPPATLDHYFSNPELNTVKDNRRNEEFMIVNAKEHEEPAVARKEQSNLRIFLKTDKEREYKNSREIFLEKRLADLVSASVRRDETFKRQLSLAQKEISRLQAAILSEISAKEAYEVKYRESELVKTELERTMLERRSEKLNSFVEFDRRIDSSIPALNKRSFDASGNNNQGFRVGIQRSALRVERQSTSDRIENVEKYNNNESINEPFASSCSSADVVRLSRSPCVGNESSVFETTVSSAQDKNINLHIQNCADSPTLTPTQNYHGEPLIFPEVPSVYARMESASKVLYNDSNFSTDLNDATESNKIVSFKNNSEDDSTDINNISAAQLQVQPPSPRQCMQIFNGFSVKKESIDTPENECKSSDNFIQHPFASAQILFSDELFHPSVKSPVTSEVSNDFPLPPSVVKQLNELTEQVTKAQTALRNVQQNYDAARREWLAEKSKVVNFHTRLEEQFIRLQKQNRQLEEEINRFKLSPRHNKESTCNY